MKSPAAELRRKSPPLAIHSSNSALRNAASIDRSQLNSSLIPTTIPQRILLQVAVGAGLVIAVATGVTYGIVYNAAKQGDLKQLETYVTERARAGRRSVFSRWKRTSRWCAASFSNGWKLPFRATFRRGEKPGSDCFRKERGAAARNSATAASTRRFGRTRIARSRRNGRRRFCARRTSATSCCRAGWIPFPASILFCPAGRTSAAHHQQIRPPYGRDDGGMARVGTGRIREDGI